MKLRKTRRAFTIVELVIVVAVIGVLAAVLIPTFVNLTNKANKAADNSLVFNLNTALAGREGEADDTANHTMQDAIDDLEVWGYKLTNLVTKSKEKLLWNEKTNRFLLEDDQLVKNSSTPEQFWQIADSIPATQKFSLLAGNKWNGTAAEGLTVGFDIGAHKEIQTVSYVGTNKNVSFRTVGGKLNIGTSTARADGEIRSYGSADKVTVYTAKECFYSHSVISYMDLKEGKAIASTNSVIYLMEAAADTIVAEEDNGVVIIPTSATSGDIQTSVENLPTGYSFDDDGHIVQPADIAQKVADNQGLLGSGTESDPFQIYDKTTMEAISVMSGTGTHKYKVNIERTNNGSIDCSDWNPVTLVGDFDGTSVLFDNLDNALFYSVTGNVKNFDINANIISSSAFKSAVVYSTEGDITIENVDVHGYLQAGQCAAYIAFGPDGASVTHFTFINCHSDMTLVATSEQTAGFIDHPYCGNGSTLTLVNSYYDGKQSNTKGKYNYYSYQVFGRLTVSDDYSGKSSLASGNTYIKQNSTTQLVKGTLTLPEVGQIFQVERAGAASHAVAVLRIGPNDKNETGNYVGTYMSEDCQLIDNSFVTSEIINFVITVNGDATSETGINGNTFNIVSSSYGTTYGSANVSIVQYDNNNNVVAINEVSIMK